MPKSNPHSEEFDKFVENMDRIELGVPRLMGMQALAASVGLPDDHFIVPYLVRVTMLSVELERTRVELWESQMELTQERMMRLAAEDRAVAEYDIDLSYFSEDK